MSELIPFSLFQQIEADTWFEDNAPSLLAIARDNKYMKETLYHVYFKLKEVPLELRPNQFVLGIDYKSQEDVLSGKEQVALNFWNPHNRGVADQFAKQVLLAQLSKIK